MKISFNRAAASRRRKAFTLVEMMVALAVGSILMSAIAALSLYTGRSFAAMANYVDLDNASRNALDTMTRDIRQVQMLNVFATNRLDFVDYDGETLSYIYNENARTLTRAKGTGRKVLLSECDRLVFNMWQRNPVPGTFNLVPISTADLCKAVDVTWICSRQIFGTKVNTESVQTARIVIRKQQD